MYLSAFWKGGLLLARNKYPEITENRILELSMQLFIEKGYEQTTLQDVADAMGMTRGAIYHHFKNKEQMVDAVTTYMFHKAVPFETIKEDTSLTALEKLKRIVLCSVSSEDQVNTFLALSKTFLDNPKLVAAYLNSVKENAEGIFLEFIKEGMNDGSVQVKNPKIVAELLSILMEIWLCPLIFMGNREDFKVKLKYAANILNSVGLPILDDELLRAFEELETIFPEK